MARQQRIFWECTQPTCGFRYVEVPGAAAPRGMTCPRCGAPARQAVVQALPAREAPIPPSERKQPPSPTIALLLDNFRSAYNVGSAFRTGDAAGVAHIYLTGISPPPTHSAVAKTALGAEQAVPWSLHPNAPRLAETLQAEGWYLWVLETAPQAVPLGSLLDQPLPRKLLLAFGNEVAGVDPALLAQANAVVALPMWGYKRSLNVASAIAASLYAVRLLGKPRMVK
ncbi:MAG: TrmH family RNA methyltransferase [Chloroflexi bacterium]|nr:TrmH family RNA methyltransferase [Chloroflexota bacterium]